MNDNNEEEYVDWFLGQAESDYNYTADELKLIKSVRASDISYHEKMTFGLLLMNYGTEKLRVRNLQERLSLSYHGKGIEEYLNEIVNFSPLLGMVYVESGESGLDEKNDYSCSFSIPVPYNENVDIYCESAKKIENKIKHVLRIILVDADKMRIIGAKDKTCQEK